MDSETLGHFIPMMKAVERGSEVAAVERISTGIDALDRELHGGLPKGRITDIYGNELSGKTYIALTTAAAVQRSGGTAVWIDADRGLDPVRARECGVSDELIVVRPDNLTDLFDMTDIIVDVADLIVIDTLNSLVKKQETECPIGDIIYGLSLSDDHEDSLLSRGIARLSRLCYTTGCTVIVTSNMHDGKHYYDRDHDVADSCKALLHFASVRLKMMRYENLYENYREKKCSINKGAIIGNRAKAKVIKSKVSPPGGEVEFDIFY